MWSATWRLLAVVIAVHLWSSDACDYEFERVHCQKDGDELSITCSGESLLRVISAETRKHETGAECSGDPSTAVQACRTGNAALARLTTTCLSRPSCTVNVADLLTPDPAACPLYQGPPFLYVRYRCEPPMLPRGRAWTKAICQGQTDPLPWVYIHSKRSDRADPYVSATFCYCTLQVKANVEVQVNPLTFVTAPATTTTTPSQCGKLRLVLVDGAQSHTICSAGDRAPLVLPCAPYPRQLSLSFVNEDPVNTSVHFNVSIWTTGKESMRTWCGQSSTTPRIPAPGVTSVPATPATRTPTPASPTSPGAPPTRLPTAPTGAGSTPGPTAGSAGTAVIKPANATTRGSTPGGPTDRLTTPSRATTSSEESTSPATTRLPTRLPTTPSLAPSPSTVGSTSPSTAEPPPPLPATGTSEDVSPSSTTTTTTTVPTPSPTVSTSEPTPAPPAANTTVAAGGKSASKTTPASPGPNGAKKPPRNPRIVENRGDETPDTVERDDSNISTGITVGVVAGCLVVFAILFVSVSITCIRMRKKKQQSHYMEAVEADDHVYAEPVYYTVPYETPPYDQDTTIDRNRGTMTVGSRQAPRPGPGVGGVAVGGAVGGADEVAYNPLFGADQQNGMLFAY